MLSIFGDQPKTIQDLRNEWAGCTKCVFSSLWKSTGPCLPSWKIAGKDVLVVGQWPGRRDMENKIPFSGKQGKKSIQYLTQAGFKENQLYTTNVLLCATPIEPNKEILLNCREQLDDILRILNPKLTIAMGAHAARRFGIKESLKTASGNPFDYGRHLVVPVIHTASIDRAKSDKDRRHVEGRVRASLISAFQIYSSK